MAYNSVAFKKSMLAWDAIAKKAPAEIAQGVKEIVGEHPEVAAQVKAWTQQIGALNGKLADALDHVIDAKDEKVRGEAGKKALGAIHQYQSFVSGTHLPPKAQANLKNGLAGLAKGLA